jgi:hypothetical protein
MENQKGADREQTEQGVQTTQDEMRILDGCGHGRSDSGDQGTA